MSDVNAAPWQPLPEEPWAVLTLVGFTHPNPRGAKFGTARLYLAFDKSGDERAGRPFTEAEAESFAAQVGGRAVLLEQTLQPGI